MPTSIEVQPTSKRSYKKHRSKEEIIANVLKAAINNATKTRIMHRCYISYNLLQKYISYATLSGLLFHDHRSNEYRITSKGLQFLDYFDQYRDTESELAFKRNLISKMLESNVEEEPLMQNFEYRTNSMLTQTAA